MSSLLAAVLAVLIGLAFVPHSQSTNQTNSSIVCDYSCLCQAENATACDLNSPLVPCSSLADEFISCTVVDLSAVSPAGAVGCTSWGAEFGDDVPTTTATCVVLNGVDCCGPTTFEKENYPCVKYSGKYFTTAIILSTFLGFGAADRFYLGYVGTGVGKLLTLGGLGVWWLVDIVLLLVGSLPPGDGSTFEDRY